MKSDCLQRSLAVDFANGELSASAATGYAQHLSGCESCQAAAAAARELIRTLRTLPEVELSRDLTGPILARVRAEESTQLPQRWFVPAAAAAAVAIVSFVCWNQFHRQTAPVVRQARVSPVNPTSASLRKAMDWLRANQENDGSWDGQKWGGRPEFQVALTALPAAAMLSSGDADLQTAMKAIHWLVSRQSDEGFFGDPGMALPYNHCLATLTLLHASEKQPSESLRASIRLALTAMLRSQTPDGGWGHYRSPFGDSSITAWHVQTLELATALGWENAGPALERGKAWLQSNDTQPALAWENQPASASSKVLFDMCGTYFLTSQLSQNAAPDSRSKLAAIRNAIVLQQVATGDDAGSWPPDDLRGKVGGRLYSTALASLALNDP